jgi:hypothetical protein
MRRRKLVATAGALTVTAFAATVAIGANFGLAGRAESDSPIGRLHPQAPTAQEVSADAVATHAAPAVPADD